jgi:hypothetical protein
MFSTPMAAYANSSLFSFQIGFVSSFDVNLNTIHVLSRAKNCGRQYHFKIWLDCHKFKKIPCLIMPTSTKCQKIEKKMTINVIEAFSYLVAETKD